MSEQLKEDNINFELRSNDVQEILEQIPHWMIRWGISAIFFSVIVLLVCAWFIKYPDVIASRIVLTSPSPALNLVARTNGKLNLLVTENEFVKEGTYLAVIENPANFNAVKKLKKELSEFEQIASKTAEWGRVDFTDGIVLGDMQSSYLAFLQSFNDYKYFIRAEYHKKKILGIKQQIAFHKELEAKLDEQKNILKKEVMSAEKAFSANQELYKKKIISKTDLNKVENSVLQARHSLVGAQKQAIQDSIQQANYQDSILELEQAFRKEKQTLELTVKDSYDKLKSALASWEQLYVLKAPTDGLVSFYKVWSSKQYVKTAALVMSVVPESGEIMGKLSLTERGAGKVKLGQVLRIKLDSYPADQFGNLEGRIKSISGVAHDGIFGVDVELPNGLITSYHKELVFKDGMQGDASIITEDFTVLERVFRQFKYLFMTRVSQ